MKWIFVFLSCCFLISCQNKKETPCPKNQEMRICLEIDPRSIDPRKNGDPWTSTINFFIYEGLTQHGSNGTTELALAKSVDISPDGLIYTFHLKDALWSDQTPITADDFEYSWKKTLSPEFGATCPNLFYPIKNAEKAMKGLVSPSEIGVKALDTKTLQVTLEHPTPYFLSLIAFCNFFPIPKHIEIQNPSWERQATEQIVQSGPFQLIKWERNKELILKKNPLYWDAKNVPFDTIHISVIADGRTALQMFLEGDLDFLSTTTTSIPPEGLSECKKKQLLQTNPVGGLVFCTFNMEKVPFSNTNIRKALSLAINRKAITDNLLQLSEVPATQFVPPVLFRQPERSLFPPFDPDLARFYLDLGMQELHLTKEDLSKSLLLSFENNEEFRKIAQAIQYQWKEVLGLEGRLDGKEGKSAMQKHMARDYLVGLDYCFAQYDDPSNIFDRFKYKATKKNLPGFENGEYVALLNQAASTNDPTVRLGFLQEAENVLAREMPIAPLFYSQEGDLISPKFTNIEISPIGNILYKKIKRANP